MDPEPEYGVMSFRSLCEMGEGADTAALDRTEADLKPDDPINIQFTSGTTARPKGATLSHFENLTEADRLTIPIPLYHCFGMVMGVLGAVSKGAAMMFPGEAFDLAQTLDVMRRVNEEMNMNEVRIVGPESQIVPVGDKGELGTRGYSVMLGY